MLWISVIVCQPGNPACRLLSKHGVFLCSAILQECQTRQMPGAS